MYLFSATIVLPSSCRVKMKINKMSPPVRHGFSSEVNGAIFLEFKSLWSSWSRQAVIQNFVEQFKRSEPLTLELIINQFE